MFGDYFMQIRLLLKQIKNHSSINSAIPSINQSISQSYKQF